MYNDIYEVIRGEKFRFPSSEDMVTNQIKDRIMNGIGNYLVENKCGYVYLNVGVRFDDKNIFIPDLCVVLNENEQIIFQRDLVRGAPDMVVEILSYSTKKRDITIKKDIYEANGVREYWIVDPWSKSIDVYLLRDGKYFLDEVYALLDKYVLLSMTDADKAEIKYEIPVKILDGLSIPLKNIFKWGYQNVD